MNEVPASSFLARNEFLIRRLHSLSGLIPVGAYMVIHLLTNAAILESPALYQRLVYGIHGLPVLWVIEWVFIFIPILFHAIIGVLMIRGSLPNSGTYKYGSNYRYTLQRATGMIAFVFILVHVFHMHGWFHAEPWVKNVVEPLGGGQFKPYNAASTGALALASIGYQIFYVVGVLSCVFHLANGIWTFGITWGIWVTPAAQRWATAAALVFGIGLGIVGLGALGGFAYGVNVEEAAQKENEMYQERVKIGDIDPDDHKRAHAKPETAAVAPPTDH
ncbi:MAG TPA: succinate dehydrogenase cytochrome b558 subunit [Pirellulaceae bacterium]|nr:succinate dehydrogenase cytochrome b558 subunit [Pirellulaceae bacterium]